MRKANEFLLTPCARGAGKGQVCHYDSNNDNGGLLNTCSGTRCELIHVYKLRVGNRKYKNTIYLKLI